MYSIEVILKSASETITQLRGDNRAMQSRLQMFDDMMLLFRNRTQDYGMNACGPDIVSLIKDYLESIPQQEPKENVTGAKNPIKPL